MVIDILKEVGALMEGHFLLSSGRHSNRYCQCAKLMQFPDKAEEVLSVVAKKLSEVEFDILVGPAMGGIIVAYELGRQLGKPAIFTERVDGEMQLRRGFTIEEGQRVIIAEDVITTGKSSFETLKTVEELGGVVVGLASIVDRSNKQISLPVYSAVELDIETWDNDECPLCKQAIPYIKPGSRNIK